MNIPHISAAVAAAIFSQRLITAGWTHIVSATGYKKFASDNHNASAVFVRAIGSGIPGVMTAFYVDQRDITGMACELEYAPRGVFVKVLRIDQHAWQQCWNEIEAASAAATNFNQQ